MRRLWMRIRMPCAIVTLLLLTLVLARLFSGPEDTWIKNDQGEWIKHGQPYGPPPDKDYKEPLTHIIIPVSFFVAFAVPLFFLRFHKLHNRLQHETATRDIKFLGYVSTALLLFGTLVGVGLILEIGLSRTNTSSGQDFLTIISIISIEGFAGLCIVVGVLLFILKRICNDHYHLEKRHRELLEILENHSH